VLLQGHLTLLPDSAVISEGDQRIMVNSLEWRGYDFVLEII